MRIDPANNIEIEIAELKKQIDNLKKECNIYFRLVEDIRSKRDGWKQYRMNSKYGDKF